MKKNRFFIAVAGVVTTVVCFAADKSARPTPEQLAPVNRLVQAFNNHESATPDIFTDDALVVDEFGPFVWHGKSEVDAWYAEVARFSQAAKGQFHVQIGAPRSLITQGERAYFVVPATWHYPDNKGKMRVQTADWLIVVAKADNQWKIAAHTWAINTDAAAAPKKAK